MNIFLVFILCYGVTPIYLWWVSESVYVDVNGLDISVSMFFATSIISWAVLYKSMCNCITTGWLTCVFTLTDICSVSPIRCGCSEWLEKRIVELLV